MGEDQSWIAVFVDDEGSRRFLGSASRRQSGGKDFTRHRGRAESFETAAAALAAGRDVKQQYESRSGYRGWIVRVDAKRIG